MLKMARTQKSAGFTLIEISIVLVIIGLITGGVLVGRDLIKAAQIRAMISQLEKYDASVNTFQSKYNGLPGDIIPQRAAPLGFVTRTGAEGDGDGNGIIYALGGGNGWYALGGENVLFFICNQRSGCDRSNQGHI